LSLANCIKSGSGYEVNLHFNIQYQKKDTEYYLYNTAVINLNVGDSVVAASKNIALYLPIVNTTILLEFTVTGNNLRMGIKDCIAMTEVKDNGIANIEYGAIEIKKVNFIDTTEGTNTGGNNNTNTPEVLSIPLTLCFDQRDALNSNDSS
jgi:hypothetical protein